MKKIDGNQVQNPKIFSAPSAPTPPKQGGDKPEGGVINLRVWVDFGSYEKL